MRNIDPTEAEVVRRIFRLSRDGKHVGTSRHLLRKVLDRERIVFYPMARGKARWYDLGVTPTLERFFGAVPALKKAVASPPGLSNKYEVRGPWPVAEGGVALDERLE